jgi:hypothetical protein
METYIAVLILPPCSTVLEKLTSLQLVKKFLAFYGTRRFITVFTSARHLSLSWASSVQSIPPHPTSWRFILILSSHLRLGLSSGLFPSGFHTKLCTHLFPLPFARHATHLHTPTLTHTYTTFDKLLWTRDRRLSENTPDNTQNSPETAIASAGFEPTVPTSKRLQTYA